MKNFEGFGLSPALAKSLAHMKYTTPTPIQAQAIPLALEGHDIMGTAQTGTGKTAAFAIPLVEKLLSEPRGSALVLTPTRELGKQIMDIMHQLLGFKSPIRTAFIIGGESIGKQVADLRRQPRLIVGTPGRINDHLERGTIKLHDTNFLVLDETDRMLDMGFSIQLEKIFKFLPNKRQTLMFSATLPHNILKLAETYMHEPKRIAVGETNTVAKNIKQEVIRIEQDKKYNELVSQLEDRSGSVIVFIKTKHGADRMANNLRRDGFTSEALHGDLRQNKRDRVMNNFRKKNFRVLIATDIAARGLDVPHIEHVINYDLPQVAEDYIHRMGRTARAGATGSAISFVSNQDGRKWHAIECLLDPQANRGKRPPADSQQRRKPRRSGSQNRYKSGDNRNADRNTRGYDEERGSRSNTYEGKKNTFKGSSRSSSENNGEERNSRSTQGNKKHAFKGSGNKPNSGYSDRNTRGYDEERSSRSNTYEGKKNTFKGSSRSSSENNGEERNSRNSHGNKSHAFKGSANKSNGNYSDRGARGNGEERGSRSADGNRSRSSAFKGNGKGKSKPGTFKSGGKPNAFKSSGKKSFSHSPRSNKKAA